MNSQKNREKLEKMMLIVLIGTLAIVFGILESMLPIQLPVPGMKLGLANTMIVIGLYYLNKKEMFTVIMLKTVLTTLLLGTFSMFLYSLVGAVLSYLCMIGIKNALKDQVSVIGVSVIGGVMHNVGQMLVAMALLKTTAVGYYMLFLLPVGLLTGIMVGIIAKLVLARLNEFELFSTHYIENKD